jgi:hypothetical protein
MSDTTLLTLEVVQFTNLQDWVWRLKNSRGRVLGEYAVKLDAKAPDYAAFLDLDTYLRANAAPDNRRDDERRLLAEVGAWIGGRVLGPIADLIIKAGTPAVVRVMVPPQAEALLYRPLDLGYAEDRRFAERRPLSLQDVSFVFELGDGRSHAPSRRRAAGGKGEETPAFSQPIPVFGRRHHIV